MTNKETLKILNNMNFQHLYGFDSSTNSIIKSKLSEIPVEYFKPTICIDEDGDTRISLIQFSLETVNLSPEKRNGLMKLYNINPYDMNKLQSIIDSIRIAKEYDSSERELVERQDEREESYGFSLASNDRINKAYPLWLAYLYSDSINPINDIRNKLREDGMEEKYTPDAIIEIMEHVNGMMRGKGEEEKKDFYIKSINDILEDKTKHIVNEIEI